MSYRSVGVDEARNLIADGAVLLDVRGEGEWNRGHAEGATHFVEGETELEKDVPIVTMCHSGIRSAIAGRKLSKQGYTVANLRGGLIAWNRAR